jgi:phosphate transport system permease protein
VQARNRFWSRWADRLFSLLCYLFALITLCFLTAILLSLILRGHHYINLTLLTKMTMPPGMVGGLANAIVGSLIMTALALIFSLPLGIAAAIYLVEFSSKTRLSHWIRFSNDVLLTTPSIIIGLMIFIVLVKPLHHFSALAGALSLACIAFPMVVRTTEDVLYLVSPLLREAALAVGLSYARMINQVVLRSARTGIITGALLAMARITGETAPLLFTALSNQFFSMNLNHPMASLPVVIYRYGMSPYPNWQALAWSGALIITLAIVCLNLLSRYFSNRQRRENP